LNEWIAGIASLCDINKSQNWRFFQFVGFGREFQLVAFGREKILVIDARFYPGSDV
jgi:hypothetical protein